MTLPRSSLRHAPPQNGGYETALRKATGQGRAVLGRSTYDLACAAAAAGVDSLASLDDWEVFRRLSPDAQRVVVAQVLVAACSPFISDQGVS